MTCRAWFACLLGLAACGHPHATPGDDDPGQHDAALDSPHGGGDGGGDDASTDGSSGTDAAPADAMPLVDAPSGPLTGGPCMSGVPGVTAYRIRWAGNGAGSTAYPVYEINGLPDHSRDHAGAYGYQIGFTPRWDDPFLGVGGLVLDGSDFVDLELTTVGLSLDLQRHARRSSAAASTPPRAAASTGRRSTAPARRRPTSSATARRISGTRRT